MEKRLRERKKKFLKVINQASNLLNLMGKAKIMLKTRISFLAEPDPACVGRMLSLQEKALCCTEWHKVLSTQQVNSMQRFSVDLFPLGWSKGALTLRFILPVAATLSILWVERPILRISFLLSIPCGAAISWQQLLLQLIPTAHLS